MARVPQPPRPPDKRDPFTERWKEGRRYFADLDEWLTQLWSVTKMAAASGTTDGSGDLVVTHGMRGAPAAILATVGGTAFRIAQPHTITKTTFTLRILDAAGNAVTAAAVTVYWQGGL